MEFMQRVNAASENDPARGILLFVRNVGMWAVIPRVRRE
jgi:hypothetical protein